MDAEMKEMFGLVLNGIHGLESHMGGLESRIDSMDGRLKAVEIDVRDIKITIENDVSKRIESLFDGYQLVHERQWEIQRQMSEMERRLQRVESLVNVG